MLHTNPASWLALLGQCWDWLAQCHYATHQPSQLTGLIGAVLGLVGTVSLCCTPTQPADWPYWVSAGTGWHSVTMLHTNPASWLALLGQCWDWLAQCHYAAHQPSQLTGLIGSVLGRGWHSVTALAGGDNKFVLQPHFVCGIMGNWLGTLCFCWHVKAAK